MTKKPTSTKEAHELLVEAQHQRLSVESARDNGTMSYGKAVSDMLTAERMEKNALEYLKLDEPAEYGTGGELVPQGEHDINYPGIACMVQEPDITAAEASLERIKLADEAGCFDAAADAAQSVGAVDSLERMLTHQMAAAHVASMKLFGRMQEELSEVNQWRGCSEVRSIATNDLTKLANAAARLMTAYQQGLATLDRRRTGGKQTVQVIHQHVDARGSQVAVAGAVEKKGGGDSGG